MTKFEEQELLRRTNNLDLHGRRIGNAGRSIDEGDYVTRKELQEFQLALARSITRTKSELVLNAPASGGNDTEFSDDFNRSNTTNGYGPNWLHWQYGYLPTSFGRIDQFKIISNAFVMGASGTNFTQSAAPIIVSPRKVMNGIWDLSQFSQATFAGATNDANSASLGGLTALTNWGATTVSVNGYVLCVVANSASPYRVQLHRLDGLGASGEGTALTNPVATNLIVGDVLRLEAILDIIGGTVTLKSYINGVLLDTYTDSNAARSTFGTPAMAQNFLTRTISATTAMQLSFDNYSCGRIAA